MKARIWITRTIEMLLGVTFLSLFSACSDLRLGEPGAVNDPEPQGTVQAQGTFQTISSSNTVTGLAQVYLTDSGTVLLRLTGFSIGFSNLRKVELLSGSTTLLSSNLRGSSGSHNYVLGTSTTTTYTTAQIIDTQLAAPNNILAIATLTTPTP